MSRKKAKLEVVPRKSATAPGAKQARKREPAPPPPAKTAAALRQAAKPATARPAPPQVSGRWLVRAVAATIAAAALCTWGVLCLLVWQGGWQLLYHPSSTIAHTPADAGLEFYPIGFATTGSGVPRLSGWWIPAAASARLSRYTVLYLHGQDGNLGDTVNHLAQLHSAGANVFAFDYRGYGQSQFVHPSEKRWLEDAGWALQYLTATRHIAPAAIVVDGSDLGADLALEFAAAHPQLAGVVLESPLENATGVIFNDGRASLVPAHLLVPDRYDLSAAATALRIPSLWFLPFPNPPADKSLPENPRFFQAVSARKMFVWLPPGKASTVNFADELARWLDDLQAH
jgi:hypothetical protein